MFPRTQIENLSVSRLMIGTNWFLGFSHTSKAQDRMIREAVDAKRVADILEVAMNAGVDTLYGMRPEPKLIEVSCPCVLGGCFVRAGEGVETLRHVKVKVSTKSV